MVQLSAEWKRQGLAKTHSRKEDCGDPPMVEAARKCGYRTAEIRRQLRQQALVKRDAADPEALTD